MSSLLLSLAGQLDDRLLQQVFTHSSLVAERNRSYERLEFLGDSVLSLCVTTELYRRFPGYAEGHLARLRAYIVSRATCAKVAQRLGLGTMLQEIAGRGRENGEVAQLMVNQNVLADLTEALIGALYVTFGYEAVRPAVIQAFTEHIDFAESSYVDYKTELQESLAKSGRSVVYRMVGFTGPPHHRQFEIEAAVDGEVLGHGVGTSKKRAEQEAAEEALLEVGARARRQSRRARLRGRRRPDETAVDAVGEAGENGAEAAGELVAGGVPDEVAGRDATDEVADAGPLAATGAAGPGEATPQAGEPAEGGREPAAGPG